MYNESEIVITPELQTSKSIIKTIERELKLTFGAAGYSWPHLVLLTTIGQVANDILLNRWC